MHMCVYMHIYIYIYIFRYICVIVLPVCCLLLASRLCPSSISSRLKKGLEVCEAHIRVFALWCVLLYKFYQCTQVVNSWLLWTVCYLYWWKQWCPLLPQSAGIFVCVVVSVPVGVVLRGSCLAVPVPVGVILCGFCLLACISIPVHLWSHSC